MSQSIIRHECISVIQFSIKSQSMLVVGRYSRLQNRRQLLQWYWIANGDGRSYESFCSGSLLDRCIGVLLVAWRCSTAPVTSPLPLRASRIRGSVPLTSVMWRAPAASTSSAGCTGCSWSRLPPAGARRKGTRLASASAPGRQMHRSTKTSRAGLTPPWCCNSTGVLAWSTANWIHIHVAVSKHRSVCGKTHDSWHHGVTPPTSQSWIKDAWLVILRMEVRSSDPGHRKNTPKEQIMVNCLVRDSWYHGVAQKKNASW